MAKTAVMEVHENLSLTLQYRSIAPSDYYSFSKLKSGLLGRKFQTDQEVVEAHFATKEENYFFKNI